MDVCDIPVSSHDSFFSVPFFARPRLAAVPPIPPPTSALPFVFPLSGRPPLVFLSLAPHPFPKPSSPLHGPFALPQIRICCPLKLAPLSCRTSRRTSAPKFCHSQSLSPASARVSFPLPLIGPHRCAFFSSAFPAQPSPALKIPISFYSELEQSPPFPPFVEVFSITVSLEGTVLVDSPPCVPNSAYKFEIPRHPCRSGSSDERVFRDLKIPPSYPPPSRSFFRISHLLSQYPSILWIKCRG